MWKHKNVKAVITKKNVKMVWTRTCENGQNAKMWNGQNTKMWNGQNTKRLKWTKRLNVNTDLTQKGEHSQNAKKIGI